MSVALRRVRYSDEPWLEGWLPDLAASVGFVADVSAAHERNIIERDGYRVGVAVYREHAPNDASAIIELIATPREHARAGSGLQAAALIEARLRKRGARSIYAPASAAHGIAMYFWIRLGYRPLLRGDWPCEREGVAWLMRRL